MRPTPVVKLTVPQFKAALLLGEPGGEGGGHGGGGGATVARSAMGIVHAGVGGGRDVLKVVLAELVGKPMTVLTVLAVLSVRLVLLALSASPPSAPARHRTAGLGVRLLLEGGTGLPDQIASLYVEPRGVVASRTEHHEGDRHGVSSPLGLAASQAPISWAAASLAGVCFDDSRNSA